MLVKTIVRQLATHICDKEQKIYSGFICLTIWIGIVYLVFGGWLFGASPAQNGRISLDLNDVNKFVLEQDAELARGHNGNCSYWDCFDVYRCGENLTIYIYPLSNYVDASDSHDEFGTMKHFSREYFEVLKTIIESPFYTTNPKEACIFVPSIDTLNLIKTSEKVVAKALASLPYWDNGENHLLFNVVPKAGGITELNTDRAIIAGADFDTWTYRSGFDLPIPYLGFNQKNFLAETVIKEQRPIWLVASILKLTGPQRRILTDLSNRSERNIVLLKYCSKKHNHNPGVRCTYRNNVTINFKSAFTQSTFCLVAKTERLFQINLIEALATNCIPVIFADNTVLPFSEVIDWSLASISLREADLHSIEVKLSAISNEKIHELRTQGDWLFNKYFESTKTIVNTMLNELNDRIFAYKAKTFFDWNTNKAKVSQNPLFLSRIAQKSQGFTAVILTYDRVESLFKLIQRLSVVQSLQKILVIWNNENEAPPHHSIFPKINKPLKVIRTKANKLSNRFYPYEEIETEAILTIDDDIVMLTADELDFGYEVWREFPDRIVGFPSRTHIWENETMRWRYESEWTNQISMVLTGAAFHHKYWSYAYTNEMPGSIKEWVDEHMNCEDIAMNFLVANFTKKPPIKVAPRKKFKCPECIHTEMLSADLGHMIERTDCTNRFAEIYGYMPLKTVEFRADPVLFKDNFPDKLKRFNDIGSL